MISASQLGPAARMVACCDAASGATESALQYLDLAEQHEPGLAIYPVLR